MLNHTVQYYRPLRKEQTRLGLQRSGKTRRGLFRGIDSAGRSSGALLRCGMLLAAILFVTAVSPSSASAADLPVTLTRTADEVVLANGFVRVGFALHHPQIDVLQGDFQGSGAYGADLTASGPDSLGRNGVVLQRTDASG